MNNTDFSSWPPHQEATFQVYEQAREESRRKAWTLAGIAAGAFFVLIVGVYFAIAPNHVDLSKDMNMSNITKKTSK
ncbi:MAG: hypothetical protein R3B48_05685 [Kofleriaceae bacterium]